MFALFRAKRKDLDMAATLYAAIVAQARTPVFYTRYAVPDTIDGRFEMICLHTFLVMNRLLTAGREGRKPAQALFDVMFRDMDRSLRERGIGDLSLPKHVKRMMKGYNGRAMAYRQALQADLPESLLVVISRNLYGTMDAPPQLAVREMAQYVCDNAAWLESRSLETLTQGDLFRSIDNEQEEDNDRSYNTGMVA